MIGLKLISRGNTRNYDTASSIKTITCQISSFIKAKFLKFGNNFAFNISLYVNKNLNMYIKNKMRMKSGS